MSGAEIARYVIGLVLLGVVIAREEMSWPHVITLGFAVGLIAGAT